MKRGSRGRMILRAATAAALALTAASCSRKTSRDLPALGREEISGERLWNRIKVESDFEDWAFWPGHEGIQPGQAPHGPFHEIYVNGVLLSALPTASRTAPAGSIIVKENRNADREVTAVTVMAKVEGFAPDAGDWFWARYDTSGKVQAEGRIQGCVACHAGMKDNDYVIVRLLDEPIPKP